MANRNTLEAKMRNKKIYQNHFQFAIAEQHMRGGLKFVVGRNNILIEQEYK
jgi:hypothetical protein